MLNALLLTELLPQELFSSENSRLKLTFIPELPIRIPLSALLSHLWYQPFSNSQRKKLKPFSDNNNQLFFYSEAMPPIRMPLS